MKRELERKMKGESGGEREKVKEKKCYLNKVNKVLSDSSLYPDVFFRHLCIKCSSSINLN